MRHSTASSAIDISVARWLCPFSSIQMASSFILFSVPADTLIHADLSSPPLRFILLDFDFCGAGAAASVSFSSETSDFGSHTIMQTNLLDMQKVKLSVRYSFNTAQSKYRGSGAGVDNKARM